MAVFKSLTFDGINSLNYGIYITGEAVYNAPERAVEMVTIPGRNGALAIDQGYFENIEVSYPCGCFAETQAEFASKVSAFRNAIASRYSYKRLTDEYNADEYRLGLYKSGLEVSAVRYGTAGQFDITFDCKPQRFLLDGDAELSPTDYSDVHTVSGDIVQIENDGSLGVKSLTASLEPIQDLHGYDKPWSGGNGKNKLYLAPQTLTDRGITWTVNADGTVTATGTLSSTNSAVYINATVPTGSYKFNGSGTGSASTTYYAQIVDGSTWSSPDYGNRDVDVTIATTNVRIYFATKVSPPTGGITFKPMLRLSTETDATYEPYSNICPISGHTERVTSVTGKNLLKTYDNLSWIPSVTKNADGSIKVVGSRTSNGAYAIGTVSLKANNTYVMKASGSADLYFQMLNASSSPVTAAGLNDGTYTPTSDETVTIRIFARANITFDTTIYPQLELGTTATTYEPYNGNTYTTSLGRTVYGGTLDVVSGVLTVTDANIASYNGETLPSTWISDRDVYSSGTTPTTGAQVVYKLSSPQTYQLTPQEVELLLGQNNLWTDCGDSTVEYGIPPYYNPTEFDAKPLIKVTGRGTLGIGEYILTITGTVTQTLYIDCETMEIYTLEGTVPTGASSLVSINKTDFPVLKSGHNGVSVGTGLSALTITPRWWRI